MNAKSVLLAAVLCTSVSVLGCARKGGSGAPPTAPDTSRGIQWFDADDVKHLFGMFITDEDEDPDVDITMNPCHDVDCAGLIEQSSGELAIVNYQCWTAFTTLERMDEDTFIPRFRWATSAYKPNWFFSEITTVPDEPLTTYRFPKCDAIQLSTDDIELAVCYEVWDDDDDDWDIGVTFITWANPFLFPGGTPTRVDHIDTFDEESGDVDEHWPDIAYDPETADLFLTYSEYTSNNPNAAVYLKYWRCDGDTKEWKGEYDVDNHAVINFNCQMPRIDVGLVDGIYRDALGDPLDDQMAVGIVYTAQYCDLWETELEHKGYHVHLFHWNAYTVDDGDKNPASDHVSRVCLRNPVGQSGEGTYNNPDYSTWYNNAGLAHIDIGPYTNNQNYGAVVFVQVVDHDLYGPVAEVWEVNSLNGTFSTITGQHTTGGWTDGLYPSVALYYEGVPDHEAAVTCLRQRGNTAQYFPWVGTIDLDNHELGYRQTLSEVDVGSLGLYNTDQIPFMNPGASSAMATMPGNLFWATWCDRMEVENQPMEVYGAYGDIDDLGGGRCVAVQDEARPPRRAVFVMRGSAGASPSRS